MTQTPVFALIGSIALLIAADFPGNIDTRALAYGGLAVNGAVLISLGTLAAPHPWVAVPLCFAVGALVSFLGLLSEVIAAGQRATLMMFILPVCTPAARSTNGCWAGPSRCRSAYPPHCCCSRPATTASCAVMPPRCAARWPTGSTAPRPPPTSPRRWTRCAPSFQGNAFRPVALTAGSRALIRVMTDLQWLCDRVDPDTGRLLGPIAEPRRPGAATTAPRCWISRPADRAGADADFDERTDRAPATAMRQLPRGHRRHPWRTRRRRRSRAGPHAAEPAHHQRDYRPDRRLIASRRRRRPAGVGPAPGPTAARNRDRRPGGPEADRVGGAGPAT